MTHILATLNAAAIVALHNSAVIEFGAPEGMGEIAEGTSKRKALAALDALCEAGNLAVNFDGETAVIVDATSEVGGDNADEGEGDNADEGDNAEGEGEVKRLGDGKGTLRAWGVQLAGDDWLKANPRGSADREAYRKERRKAARAARKARIAEKHSAVNEGAE